MQLRPSASTKSPAMSSFDQDAAPIIADEGIFAADVENAGSSPAGGASSGKPYFRSIKFVEVILCFVPLMIGFTLELADAYERPIPHQTLDGSGQILRNMVYDLRETGETIPTALMFSLAFFIPGALQAALILYSRTEVAFDRADALHKTACVYFMAGGLTELLTIFCKLYTGYLRPIFYEMCRPDEDYRECTAPTGLASDGSQARVSFPSGHASLTMCGMMLLSLYLDDSFGKAAHDKLKAKRPDHRPRKLFRILSVLCYAPVLVSYFVGISRVHDNHHHPADVVMGMLLGGTVAKFIFGIWFQ